MGTSKHNFQFCAKHVRPCHAEEKYLCLDIMEVVIGFSMLKKAKNRTQKRTRMTCQTKVTCQKRETCQIRTNMSKKRNMPKSKERRKKTEKKRAKIARCLIKKVKTNFILFVSTLAKAFFAFRAFLYTLLGGPIVQISIYFFYEIYLL